MLIRLIGGIAAVAIALGALAFPSATPAQAGSTKCTGWTSTLVPPTSIRVYRTATKRTETVRFRTYVESVMASEWGTTAPAAALRVGAIAAKQYAWYYALFWRGGRDAAGRCFDVRDTWVDQVYNPRKPATAAQLAAVEATWRVSFRKGDRFFLTGYRSGSGSCTANIDGWRLYQRDAVDCVRTYDDTAEALARRFYSAVSWITPGTGDYTGDGRGDLAVLTHSAETGEATATVYTSDSEYKAEVATGALEGVAVTAVPPDRVRGRAAGDVDGDGLADLVQLVRTDTGIALEVMRGGPTGLAPATAWWSEVTDPVVPTDPSAPVDPSLPPDPAVPLEPAYRLVVADFDGDGRADAGIVRIRPGTPPPAPGDEVPAPADPPPAPADPPFSALDLAISTGAGFEQAGRAWEEGADLTTSAFLAGDVNGDGRGELVVLTPLEGGGTALRVAASSPAGPLGPLESWGIEPLALDAIHPVIGDATRDGRDDLIIVGRDGADGVRVIVNRASSTAPAFERRYFTGSLPLPFSGIRLSTADLTGDGRADLSALVDRGKDADGLPLGTDAWRLVSTGVSFTPQPWFTSATMAWESAFPY